MIISVNTVNPQPRLINRTVEVLRSGGIIAYPTDTVYGIGCDIFNKRAIEKIYQIKQRPRHKPFSFICADLKNISEYAHVSNFAYKIMRKLLPGPYTFILEGSSLVPKLMLTRRRTVGIRVPDHTVCLAIVRALGHPIVSTSAAIGDFQIMTGDPEEIEEKLGPSLNLVVDGGILYPEPSTVVSLIDDSPEIIRVGKGGISLFS
ncbi:MAG: L-threonylcarbamoyladenylate synthase [Thermodesulfobacteriota bacterium]|nr:L-threonylcarbamoyladenylate synthase [Thermodesulfobacteriota bacterium]